MISHNKTRLIMSKAQPSSTALDSRKHERDIPRLCQRDLSQRWGRDTGVSREMGKSRSAVGFDFFVWGRA